MRNYLQSPKLAGIAFAGLFVGLLIYWSLSGPRWLTQLLIVVGITFAAFELFVRDRPRGTERKFGVLHLDRLAIWQRILILFMILSVPLLLIALVAWLNHR